MAAGGTLWQRSLLLCPLWRAPQPRATAERSSIAARRPASSSGVDGAPRRRRRQDITYQRAKTSPHTNRTPPRPPHGKCLCPEEDQPPMTTGSRAIGCDSLAALKSAILRINHPRGRRIDAAPAAAARGRRATPRPRAGFSSNRRRGARARARRTRRRAAPRRERRASKSRARTTTADLLRRARGGEGLRRRRCPGRPRRRWPGPCPGSPST